MLCLFYHNKKKVKMANFMFIYLTTKIFLIQFLSFIGHILSAQYPHVAGSYQQPYWTVHT